MKTSRKNNDVLPTALPVLRDRWFEPLRTPWRRRALATVWVVLMITTVTLIVSGGSALDVGLPALLVGSLLNVTMRNMADAPPDRLDERMVAARDHAFRVAYYGVALMLLAGLGAILALDRAPITIESQQLIATAWCTALVAMFLPAAILAWTEESV